MLKEAQIRTFYTKRMNTRSPGTGSSQSPEKPGKLMAFLKEKKLEEYFQIHPSFKPFRKKDFYIAHSKDYVDSFFSKQLEKRYERILGLSWSKEFANTTRYTNASLFHAIQSSIKQPSRVCFSPTSGFHHAVPDRGALYCSFSGQVIASIKIYEQYGLSGCYIDLDGHYGNSIPGSYKFVKNLDKAIPPEIGNINPSSTHQKYLDDFRQSLQDLEKAIVDGIIHYLVFCHGADSHEWDDMGYQLTTDEWIQCSELFYSLVFNLQHKLKKQIPLCVSLFGGYRKDDYRSVLSLHTADLVKCLEILCGQTLDFKIEIKQKNMS